MKLLYEKVFDETKINVGQLLSCQLAVTEKEQFFFEQGDFENWRAASLAKFTHDLTVQSWTTRAF